MNGPGLAFPIWKRVMDVVLSCMGLLIALPLLMLIASIIKIVSPGPAFLKQERIGRYGKPFLLWKFRTMRAGADAGPHQIHLQELILTDTPMIKLDEHADPRVFPFG